MSAPHSWLAYYFSFTPREKVMSLLSNKILYFEGVFAGLGGVSCFNGGIITEEIAKASHVENIISICKMIQKAISPQETMTLKDTHAVAYNLQEFVKTVTLPAITFQALQEQVICGIDVLTNY
jgi:hypothetical protein